jgi:phosphate transport system protein
MRTTFREQLDSLRGSLVVMGADVTSAMRWATESLLEGNLEPASQCIDAAATIRRRREEVEEAVVTLLVRQQPVASDLRLALASLHVAADFERMGALAAHVAKIMLLRHPVTAVPPEVAEVARKMAAVAEHLAWKVTGVLETGDATLASQLEADDDEMDDLHRQMFEVLFGQWSHDVRAAVDAALLARFYERYADHAVNAAQQVVYLVTGVPPAEQTEA